ncbi:MAG: hypothetical protein ORN56_01760, partial [Chitinophagales bacterium]|nr:hypothetical protein [Chitinophagales bacterium]
QEFTGSIAQTITLPVTSTLATGHQFYIINNSSVVITVNSSGSNLVVAVPAASRAVLTCILASGTTAASWSADVSNSTGSATSSIATVITATTTLTENNTFLCDNSSAAYTVTLPTASSSNAGKIILIRKIDESANVLTISPPIIITRTSGTATTLTTLNYPRTLRVQSDGANWWLID